MGGGRSRKTEGSGNGRGERHRDTMAEMERQGERHAQREMRRDGVGREAVDTLPQTLGYVP